MKKHANMDGAEKADLIKWLDALDLLGDISRSFGDMLDLYQALRVARECRHPDAVWLTSLFPGEDVMQVARFVEVLGREGDDPRAVFLRCCCFEGDDPERPGALRQAVEQGYPPAMRMWAQVLLADAARQPEAMPFDEANELMARAAEQGDRRALEIMAEAVQEAHGVQRALPMLKAAAELGILGAMLTVAEADSSLHAQERVSLLKQALSRNCREAMTRMSDMVQASSSVELAYAVGEACHCHMDTGGVCTVTLVLAGGVFSDARDGAWAAIACWLAVGRRLGVVKDIRAMLAAMLWRERHQWAKPMPEPCDGA
jgi:hypothetical protein